MSSTSSSSSPLAAIFNVIFAIGFVAAGIYGIIEGVHVLTTHHRWGLIALAACITAIGVIGFIRKAVFSGQAQEDGIVFLVDISSEGLPYFIASIVLLVIGVVVFFISPPF